MHPKNVPIVVVASMIYGAVLLTTWMISDHDLYIMACALVVSVAALVLGLFLQDNDIITLERFNQILEGIQAEIKAHREDHEVRAYDPQSVGQSLTTLAAQVSKSNQQLNTYMDRVSSLDALLRDRLERAQTHPGRGGTAEPDP